MNTNGSQVRLSAILGSMGVGLGAAGAHGRVHDMVEATGHLAEWSTAVEYHLLHAILLLLIALFGRSASRFSAVSWNLIFWGIVFFSGSLYVMGLTGIKWLGAITPVGGLCLIAGWLVLALGANRGAESSGK